MNFAAALSAAIAIAIAIAIAAAVADDVAIARFALVCFAVGLRNKLYINVSYTFNYILCAFKKDYCISAGSALSHLPATLRVARPGLSLTMELGLNAYLNQ